MDSAARVPTGLNDLPNASQRFQGSALDTRYKEVRLIRLVPRSNASQRFQDNASVREMKSYAVSELSQAFATMIRSDQSSSTSASIKDVMSKIET